MLGRSVCLRTCAGLAVGITSPVTQACYGDETQTPVDAAMPADAGEDAGEKYPWIGTPSERFIDVSTDGGSACGIANDGSIICWGHSFAAATTLVSPHRGIPSGAFSDVSIEGYGCAVRNSGELICWGGASSYEGERVPWNPPSGKFVQVSAGYRHACGIRLDDTVACWGAGEVLGECGVIDADCGQAIPPEGRFAKIAAGDVHTCGIKDDGSVHCWGAGTKATAKCALAANPERSSPDFYECGQSRPPPGRFIDIASGDLQSCAVRDDRLVFCWGEGSSDVRRPLGDVQVVQIDGTCGLTSAGAVVCSSTLGFEKVAPPFKQIVQESGRFCGLVRDGTASCWRWLEGTNWEPF